MADDSQRQDDRDIVLRVQAGDRDAFGMLVRRYMRRAYFGAVGLVGSHEDALDLSQEAFVRAFKARESIDPDRPFYTWYYQILRRLCFNLARDRRTRADRLDGAQHWLVAEAESRGPGTPQDSAGSEELRAQVRQAIEELPPAEREIIVLREFQDMSYSEIADLLEVPKGTVMSRLYAARKKLAASLGDDR